MVAAVNGLVAESEAIAPAARGRRGPAIDGASAHGTTLM